MGGLSRTKRIPEIELMKVFAIVGMIFVHVIEFSMDSFENAWELPGSIPYTLIEFLGGIPAAGAFTFAMGWGAAYSDKATPRSYLKRAAFLGALLFYVNFIYAILPGLIYPEYYGAFSTYPWAVIGFNIYSFAAVCMLFFALMKKLQDKPMVRLTICLCLFVAVIIGSYVSKPEAMIESGNQWVATLAGIFVRQNDFSWFPLVPWFTFPLMGYGAGNLYRKWNDRKKFALTALGIGIVLVPSAVILNNMLGRAQGAANPGWVETAVEYYSLSTIDVFCAIGILCLEIALVFGLLTLSKGKLHWILADMSENVMNIFCGQWLFMSPFCIILTGITNVWLNVLWGLAAFVITCTLAEIGLRYTRKKKAGQVKS